MAKFGLITEKQASGATSRIFEEILAVKHLRNIPNFFKTLANSPSVLQGTWNVYRDVSTRGLVDEALKEMIFVAISAAKSCAYCEAAHLAFCRILKVDAETCKNLIENIDTLQPERTREIVRFAVKVGVQPSSLTDDDYKLLTNYKVIEEEIIEIVAMSAFAVYAITVAEALKLEVDKWD